VAEGLKKLGVDVSPLMSGVAGTPPPPVDGPPGS
jgi:hypothetical protein